VVKNHPKCETILLASISKNHGFLTKSKGKTFWSDPEGHTWWHSENGVLEAKKIRSTLENQQANTVELINPENLTTSTIPIAKMQLVEDEGKEKQKDTAVQCLLCTRTWKGPTAKYRIEHHVQTYHPVPIIIQHSILQKPIGRTITQCKPTKDYLKICNRSADRIGFTCSDVTINAGQVTLIKPVNSQTELCQEEIDYSDITAAEDSNTKDQNDIDSTNPDNQVQEPSERTQNANDSSQNDEPTAIHS